LSVKETNQQRRACLESLLTIVRNLIKTPDEVNAHLIVREVVALGLETIEAYEGDHVMKARIKAVALLKESQRHSEKYFDEQQQKGDWLVFADMVSAAYHALDYFLDAT